MESEKDPYRSQMDRLSFRTKAIVYLSLKSRVLKLFSTSSACIEKLDCAIHYLNKKWLSINKRSSIREKTFVIPSPPKNTIEGSIRYKVFADYIKEPWKHKIHENVRAQQKKALPIDNSLSLESNMSVSNDVRPDSANVFGFEYFGIDLEYLGIFILVLKEHSLEKRKLLDSRSLW